MCVLFFHQCISYRIYYIFKICNDYSYAKLYAIYLEIICLFINTNLQWWSQKWVNTKWDMSLQQHSLSYTLTKHTQIEMLAKKGKCSTSGELIKYLIGADKNTERKQKIVRLLARFLDRVRILGAKNLMN